MRISDWSSDVCSSDLSFWKYWRGSFERNAGLRIDHLLLNEPATKRLEAAGVDTRPRGWEKTNDHAPAWIELAAKTARARKSRTLKDHKTPAHRGKETSTWRARRRRRALGAGLRRPPARNASTSALPRPRHTNTGDP